MMKKLRLLLRSIAHAAVWQRLGNRFWLFVLVFLAQLRVLYAYLPYQNEVPSHEVQALVLDQLLRIGGWAGLLLLLLSLVQAKWLARLLGGLIAVLALLLSGYELYLISTYHVVYNIDLAQIMLSTNWREGGEFIDSITREQLLSVCWHLLPSLGAALLTALLARFLRAPAFATGLLCIILALLGPLYHLPRDLEHYKTHTSFTGLQVTGFDRLLHNTLAAHAATKRIAEERTKIQQAQRAVTALTIPRPISQDPLQVILILGESARRDYLHAYGYPLPNTPHADSLLERGELIAFTDVVSSATATILSNTRSLTFYTQERSQEPWYRFPSILQVLKQAGYATVWIANQEITGEYSMSNLLGRQADLLTGNPAFFKGLGGEGVSDRPDLYDEAILPLLQHYDTLPDSLREASPRGLFQVVHLMGSHMTYRERYPKHFERFTTADLSLQKGGGKDQTIIDYVHSILYTDHIIHEIISTYRDENALVLYLSDHGDALYDEDYPELMGHALTPQAVAIPLFVYFSPKLRRERPELWRQLGRQRDKRIMSDLLTHALVDLLGIHTEYTEPRYNFFSPSYDEHRKRIVVAPTSTRKLIL